MRTTISLDDDVTAAVIEFRRHGNLGLSQAVNQLIRQGLHAPREPASSSGLPTSDSGST